MNKFLALSAAVLASGGALAADLPRREAAPAPAPIYAAPIFTWTGLYVGLNAGYGFAGNRNVGISGNGVIAAAQPNPVPFGLSPKRDGFIGGAQIGYNVQMGALVYGVEVDFQGADIKGAATFCAIPAGCGNVATTASSKLEWLGTFRGRLGYSFDRALIYVTGGLAVGSTRNSLTVNEFAGVGRQWNASSNSTRAGYTIGAGVEYAINNNWSVKGEYLYYDLGRRNVVSGQFNPVGPSLVAGRFRNDGHIVRAGLNYRFGGAAGPVLARY